MHRLLLLLAALSGPAIAGPDLKVAAPGLASHGVDPKVAAFFSDHLAQQLAHQGLTIITATEISTLIGLERQRQLMGCEDCHTELGNALGVRAVLHGMLTRNASGYELRVQLNDVERGGTLAQAARTARDEEALLGATSDLARELGRTVLGTDEHQRRVGSLATFEDRMNVLTVGLPQLTFGLFGVEYERVFSDVVTAFVAPQYLAQTAFSTGGFEVTAGARAYLFGEAPRGFYAGAYALAGAGAEGFGSGVGAELGYQWLLSNRVAVALSYGHGWRITDGYLRTHLGELPQINRFRLNVGVAF